MNLTDRQKINLIQSVLLRAEDAKQMGLIKAIVNNTLLTTNLEDLKGLVYPYQSREIDKALEEKQRIRETLEKKAKNASEPTGNALATATVDPERVYNETENAPKHLQIKPKK